MTPELASIWLMRALTHREAQAMTQETHSPLDMRPTTTYDPAEQFASDVLAHHAELLASGDEEARNAVIIKSVALLALAFGIPAIAGEPLNVEEAIEKLEQALAVIASKS